MVRHIGVVLLCTWTKRGTAPKWDEKKTICFKVGLCRKEMLSGRTRREEGLIPFRTRIVQTANRTKRRTMPRGRNR